MCAGMIGVDRKIAALIDDCDRLLTDLPKTDGRWRARVEAQRQRLLDPDLRTIVALATSLAEDTPTLAVLVAAAMKDLVAADPTLAPFALRLLNAGADALAA
jgi:hypothetical protein